MSLAPLHVCCFLKHLLLPSTASSLCRGFQGRQLSPSPYTHRLKLLLLGSESHLMEEVLPTTSFSFIGILSLISTWASIHAPGSSWVQTTQFSPPCLLHVATHQNLEDESTRDIFSAAEHCVILDPLLKIMSDVCMSTFFFSF